METTDQGLERVAREAAQAIHHREYLNDPEADFHEVWSIVLSALKQVGEKADRLERLSNQLYTDLRNGKLPEDNGTGLVQEVRAIIMQRDAALKQVQPNSERMTETEAVVAIIEACTLPDSLQKRNSRLREIVRQLVRPNSEKWEVRTNGDTAWICEKCGKIICDGLCGESERLVLKVICDAHNAALSPSAQKGGDVAERTDKGCGPYLSDV